MKAPLLWLLAASVAGNVAFAVLVSRTAGVGPVTGASSAAIPASAAATGSSGAPAKASASPGLWTTLRPGDDLPSLVANLRRAGFPADIVRAIAVSLLDEQFASRLAALSQASQRPYWKMSQGISLSEEQQAAAKALNEEYQKRLKELLGSEATEVSESMKIGRRRQYGSIAPEKIEALTKIRSDYSEIRSKLYSGADSDKITATERVKQNQLLAEEERKDLADLLTPEELEQYDLRNSSSASKLRSALAKVDVNEAEYVSLFHLQKAYDDAYGTTPGVIKADWSAQRSAAQEKLRSDIRAALGDERYYQYLETQDTGFASARRLARQFSLPASTALAVYSLQSELQTSLKQTLTLRGSGVTQEQVQAARLAAVQATDARLTSLVGAEAAATYKKSSGGRWLQQQLQPSAVSPPVLQMPSHY